MLDAITESLDDAEFECWRSRSRDIVPFVAII